MNNKYYHTHCVELYPIGFVAYVGEDFLGETESEDGESAFMILDTDRYLDDAEVEG